MADIRANDAHVAWRREWMPARFRDAYFHVEIGAKENGRRIIVHEFPKKEYPYAEDMGRKAIEFSVTGYVICFPFDSDSAAQNASLYQRDYRIARDKLIRELEREGPGELQLPTLPLMNVVCSRYRVQERRQLGGYAEFEMLFYEKGKKPFEPRASTAQAVTTAQLNLYSAIVNSYGASKVVQP
jgi:prophage DNA circulation protein